MMTSSSDTSLSNPFSTGAGGSTFEQLVGASYLVSLLAGHIPRGLEWGVTRQVQFQQRWAGCLIDDVVVVSSDGAQERRLAIQLKHDLGFTRSDEMFARVIKDCWDVFTGSRGWQFDPQVDRIGIGLGVYQTKLDAHFRPLLEWARTAQNASEFLQKVSLARFSSEEKREYLSLIRDLLNTAKGSAVTDDEVWRFLASLVVLHFDLENAGSRDTSQCWNSLLNLLPSKNDVQARALIDNLCAVVAKYNRSAGSLDYARIRAEISPSVVFKDQPQYGPDLKRLRDHSQKTLRAIKDVIGLQIQLPRLHVLDRLEQAVHTQDILVIAGEPMVGKSGLLKLLATRLQLEGEVLAFFMGDFAASTNLVSFLHSINITTEFADLLAAAGTATNRCIFIDSLERATDDNKRRLVNDILFAVPIPSPRMKWNE